MDCITKAADVFVYDLIISHLVSSYRAHIYIHSFNNRCGYLNEESYTISGSS